MGLIPTPEETQQSNVVVPPNNGGAAPVTASSSPSVTTSASSTPAPLLVTSNASRSEYGNNVTKMQTMTQPNPQSLAVSGSVAGDTTPANTNGSSSSPTINIHTGSSSTDTSAASKTSAPQTLADGSTTMNEATARSLFGTNFTGLTQQADGTYVADKSAMARLNTGASGDGTSADGTDTSGLPPAISKMLQDNVTQMTQGATDAQTNLDNVRISVNQTNDPVLAGILDTISSQYKVLLDAMQKKNDIVFGKNMKNSAQGGMMQFASEMNTAFLNDQQSRADQRMSDLVTKEQAALQKASDAYKAGNVKMLNDAMTEASKANADKSKAIMDLYTATNNAVKNVQAQSKIDAATAKQQVTDDIRISTNLGKTMADSIKASGITDPAQIDAYVQAMAEKNGVTNVDILKSALVTAQQAQEKLDASLANTNSEIKKRNQAKTAGDKPTVQSATDALKPGLKPISEGGVLGADGYMDPNTWIAQRDEWISNKLPVATFNTLYKRYLNPASYQMAGFKSATSSGPQFALPPSK